MTHDAQPAISPAVAREALAWRIRLDAGEASESDWRRWREAHPEHEQACQRIEAVDRRLAPLRGGTPASLARATLLAPKPRRRHLKTLILLASAGGVAWLAQEQAPRWQPWLAEHRTARGQRKTLALPDGSVVILNGGTALDVHYGDDERRLILRAGELLVETATDRSARPFRVETPGGELETLGTRFLVRDLDLAVRVDVYAGRVLLTPKTGRAGILAGGPVAGRFIEAGQRAWLAPDRIGGPVAADPDAAAWRDGLLVASRMRLDDFLAELDRYSEARIICAPGVADLRLSGTYPLANPEQVLATIGRVLPLTLVHSTRRWGRDEIRVEAKPLG